jgi:hypothetical protein
VDGGGSRVRIDDDFDAVIEKQQFDDVADVVLGFECPQACSDGGLLKLAADFLGHSGGFG